MAMVEATLVMVTVVDGGDDEDGAVTVMKAVAVDDGVDGSGSDGGYGNRC